MIQHKHTRAFLALILLIFVLQGCNHSLQPNTTQAPSNTALLSPSVQPTRSPLPTIHASSTIPSAVVSATAAEATSAAPANTEIDIYECNLFTACNGSTIFYYNGKSVHRMDSNGKNDIVINIKNFDSFIDIDANGLYYLENDKEYVPTEQEEGWNDYSLSFNLVQYEPSTQKKTIIQSHIYCAHSVGEKIFMTSHIGPNRILDYDKINRTVGQVTGFPRDFEDLRFYDVIYYYLSNKTYICFTDKFVSYLIQDQQVDTSIAYQDKDIRKMDPGVVESPLTYWDGDDDVLTLVVNNSRKVIDLQGDLVDIVYSDFNYLYVYTVKPDYQDSDYESIFLYKVSDNGDIVKLLYRKKLKMKYAQIINEFVNGWDFFFWSDSDFGPVYGIVYKQKVA